MAGTGGLVVVETGGIIETEGVGWGLVTAVGVTLMPGGVIGLGEAVIAGGDMVAGAVVVAAGDEQALAIKAEVIINKLIIFNFRLRELPLTGVISPGRLA